MGWNRFGQNVNFHTFEGLGRLNEPFHLFELVSLAQNRRLEFFVDPGFRLI